jgi:hypothetical protein
MSLLGRELAQAVPSLAAATLAGRKGLFASHPGIYRHGRQQLWRATALIPNSARPGLLRLRQARDSYLNDPPRGLDRSRLATAPRQLGAQPSIPNGLAPVRLPPPQARNSSIQNLVTPCPEASTGNCLVTALLPFSE